MNSEIDALSSTLDGRELENKKFMLEIKESALEFSKLEMKAYWPISRGQINDLLSLYRVLRFLDEKPDFIHHNDLVRRIETGLQDMMISVHSLRKRFGLLSEGVIRTLEEVKNKISKIIHSSKLRFSIIFQNLKDQNFSLLSLLNFDSDVYETGFQQNTLYSVSTIFGILDWIIRSSPSNPLQTAIVLRILIENFGIFRDIEMPAQFHSLLIMAAATTTDGLLNAYDLQIFEKMVGVSVDNTLCIIRAGEKIAGWEDPIQYAINVMEQFLDEYTEAIRKELLWTRIIEQSSAGEYQINITDHGFFSLVGLRSGIENIEIHRMLMTTNPQYQALADSNKSDTITEQQRHAIQRLRYQWYSFLILHFIAEAIYNNKIHHIRIESMDDWTKAIRIFKFDLTIGNDAELLREIQKWMDHISGSESNLPGRYNSFWGQRGWQEVRSPFEERYHIRDGNIARQLGLWYYAATLTNSRISHRGGSRNRAAVMRSLGIVVRIWQDLTGRQLSGRDLKKVVIVWKTGKFKRYRGQLFAKYLGFRFLKEFAGLMHTYLDMLHQLKINPITQGELTTTVSRGQAFGELALYLSRGVQIQLGVNSEFYNLINAPQNQT